MESEGSKISKTVNDLKNFFEQLSDPTKSQDFNNNNSNFRSFSQDSSKTFRKYSFKSKPKIANPIKDKLFKPKKSTSLNNYKNRKKDKENLDISIKNLSEHSIQFKFDSDKLSKDFENVPIIFESNSEIDQEKEKISQEKVQKSEFSFNLFKLLKLLLTAKCYCVLLSENKNKNDLKKLIFILYELKQIGFRKLINIDQSDIDNAKLNDFLLADLYNLLCQVHVGIFLN